MAVPGTVKLISNSDEFAYATLLHLLKARNLRLISIWNPKKMMLDRLDEWAPQDIFRSRKSAEAQMDSRRRFEVREALCAASKQETYAGPWLELRLINLPQ